MKKYHNVMEDLVEEEYERCKAFSNCCTCEQCHADVVAYTLNHLPPQYAATQVGTVYTKINNLRQQHVADIRTVLAQAFQQVSQSPRHEDEVK